MITFKKVLAAAISISIVALSGCTDAEKAKFTSIGNAARVVCFSGDRKTFDDFSTGKIESEKGSDGYYFVARSTQRLVHVSGACNLDYGAEVPANFKPVHPFNLP